MEDQIPVDATTETTPPVAETPQRQKPAAPAAKTPVVATPKPTPAATAQIAKEKTLTHSEKSYAELTPSTILCFLSEREKFATDKFTNDASTEKEEVHLFYTKSFWENVEKDSKGVPKYLRMRLLGLAVFNEDAKKYDGYLPFK